MRTPLTEHFTLEELAVTSTDLDNTPDALQTALLKTLAIFLEKVRVVLGNHPVLIDSAFRSPAVNAAVGGVSNDAHEACYGADIRVPDFGTPFEVAQALDAADHAGKIAFDQLIYEQTWVHISRDPQRREQRLTRAADGTYLAGIVGP